MRPQLGPVASRALAYRLLTLAEVRAELSQTRITAAHDPLRAVPRGTFTLEDYSCDSSGLSHYHFRNCELRSLNGRA